MEVSPFGELLTTLRTRCRISQQELARKLDVHRNTISKWERGVCLPESKGLVLEIARQLRLDAKDTRHLLEASLTALSPYWQMPYPRNPFFTGREEVLLRLHEALHHDHTAILSQSYALSGLGGIGKTQTAIEYAYRYAADYSAVFWLSAETSESLFASFLAIADLLDLPEQQEQEQGRVVAAVIRWLNSHSDWLLILDNVEDPEVVKGVLPTAQSGSLLFNSRRQTLGLTAQTLDLEQMTSEEGMRLLLQRARLLDSPDALEQLPEADWEHARTLVTLMGGLPLALDQAGAYIEATRCSLSDYLRLFQAAQLRLLDERATHAEHPLSVTRTFTLAFAQLEQRNPAATELLTVCAFLAPEAIPEDIFIEGAASLGPSFETLAAHPLLFRAALKTLRTYSLIQRDAAAHTLTIHRLVQAVLRERLPEATRSTWLACVLHAMIRLFPSEKTQANYWRACERLLPHTLMCITLSDRWAQNAVERITLMGRVAMYLANYARFTEAEQLYQQAVRVGEQALGPEHPLVADAVYGWGSLYRVQGRYKDAEPLYQRVLRIREHILGLEHSQVARLLISLALLHKEQGKYAQAEVEYQRALHILERQSGPEAISKPGLLNNLADLYREQGRYEEAEPLLQRAISLWEQALGAEDTNVAYPLHNLAEVYSEQGKYGQAEPLYRRALGNWEQALGSEHPLVAEPLTGLATLLKEQKQYEQAEALYRRALYIQEQALDSKHHRLAYALQGLADLYTRLERYEDAELFYQRVLALRQQHLDPLHPHLAECFYDLAHLYQKKQDNLDKALSLAERALDIYTQALGDVHPKTVATRMLCIQLVQAQEGVEAAERPT